MKFLSEAEALNAANDLGLELSTLAETVLSLRSSNVAKSVRFSFSDAIARSFALARMLAGWLPESGTCLVIVNEYGIWPSSENRHLFARLRSSYGETRRINEAPGHVFSPGERDDLITLLDLIVRFGWGCIVLSSHATTSLMISHDEWMIVASEQGRDRIAEEAEEFGLTKELTP